MVMGYVFYGVAQSLAVDRKHSKYKLRACKMNTPNLIAVYAGLITIPGLILWTCISGYLGYFQLAELLKHFKKSPVVLGSIWLRDAGTTNVVLLIYTITQVVTFPAPHLKNGGLSYEDLTNIPSTLRRQLITLHWMHHLLLAAGVMFSFPFMLYEWISKT